MFQEQFFFCGREELSVAADFDFDFVTLKIFNMHKNINNTLKGRENKKHNRSPLNLDPYQQQGSASCWTVDEHDCFRCAYINLQTNLFERLSHVIHIAHVTHLQIVISEKGM